MIDIKKLVEVTELRYKNDYDNGIVAFVHAKGNSARVPAKNMRILGDKPLFCHAIENAKASSLIDAVVIDSDSDEILEIGAEYGAIPLKRPKELANNMTTGDDLAYWQALNFPKSNIIIQVIPTAPFLTGKTIDKAIMMLMDEPNLDSVAGIYEDSFYTWKDGFPDYYNFDGTIPNSVDLVKTIYETTGLYANHTEAVLRTKRRLNPRNCKGCILSKIESIDINYEDDFNFAEIVWRGIHNSKQ